jgi:hypothetical protein
MQFETEALSAHSKPAQNHNKFMLQTSSKTHITTWSLQRTSRTGEVTTIYNQIDYIIIDKKHKHAITNSRSYSGTETYSDHRLVVTRMIVQWATLYKKTEKRNNTKKLNINLLAQNKEAQLNYQQNIQNSLEASTSIN